MNGNNWRNMSRISTPVNLVNWCVGQDGDMTEWHDMDVKFLSFVRGVGTQRATTPTERLQIILGHPNLHIRAADLITFITKCPPEALKDNFQIIVNSIFGVSFEWNLRSIKKTEHPNETSLILKLLAPDGPLMNVALKLMDDHNFLLEFPLDGLHPQLKKKILDSDPPPFFANKVGHAPQSTFGLRNGLQNLLLNPFEYYMFSFASVNLQAINPTRPTNQDYLNGWQGLTDTIYTALLEEYLLYFFPCDGNGVPPHHFQYSSQPSNFMANSLLRQQQTKSKIGVTFTSHHSSEAISEANLPKLFKPAVLQETSGAMIPREKMFLATHPSAYKEVWRSETMFHIFMEMWMCGYHEAMEKQSTFTPQSGSLPSVEIVKSIRLLVKHMHFFINCVNAHSLHPMDEIRRTCFPVFQRRLYAFLRYLFHYWPLDNSFRIVYETWLSYIQPWRYMTVDRERRGYLLPSEDVPVDRRWFSFILENILFYSKLCSQIILRLERVDLTATKNALMLYRVAKVYTTQESLKFMLQEIDQGIQTYISQNHTPSGGTQPTSILKSSKSARMGSNGGYLGGGRVSPILTSASSPSPSPAVTHSSYAEFAFSGTSSALAKYSHVKQLMHDLESPHYIYESIFSPDNTNKMRLLLSAAAEARVWLLESADDFNRKEAKNRTFYAQLVKLLTPEESNDAKLATYNNSERVKAGNHLEFSRHSLATFFEIQLGEPKIPHQSFNGFRQRQNVSPSLSKSSLFSPDISSPTASSPYHGNVSSGSRSSPKTALPVGVVLDHETIPVGNPDESLCRSDEFRILVRFLTWVSSFFNYVFEDHIDDMYFSSSVSGRYLRAMLAEPTEYFLTNRRSLSEGFRRPFRTVHYLGPRVALRPFASHGFLIMTLLIFVCATGLFNLSPFMGILAAISLYFMYLTFRAASEPLNKLEELRHLRSLYSEDSSHPRQEDASGSEPVHYNFSQ